MSLSFADAPGNLFNVLGKCGALLENARTNQDLQFVALTNTTTGLVGQLENEPDVQALVGDGYIGALDAIGATVGSLARSVAVAALNRLVFRDNPQYNQTLVAADTLTSLREVIRQMEDQGATVLSYTVTATPDVVTGNPGPHFIGTGDGAVVMSVRRALDGRVLENIYQEDLKITCTNDSYNGRATAGNESMQFTGVGAQTDTSAFNWPLGSNCSVSASAIDGSADNSSGNLLTNSGMDTWSGGAPSNFTTLGGVTGTNFDEEVGLAFDGGSALKITGDAGGTEVGFRQQFEDPDGTNGELEPTTQYAFNLWARRDGAVSANGVLTIDLIDGNGTVVQDDGGNNNSFTVDLTALTTEYKPFSGSFRTPSIMPDEVHWRFRTTTAYDNGRSFYLDRMGMGVMARLYAGGPRGAVFSGSIPFQAGDFATVTVTNTRGGGGEIDSFQTLCGLRLFPEMMTNELLLPSSSSPSISDALIG